MAGRAQGREGEKVHAVQGRVGHGREDAGGTGFSGGRGPSFPP